jgi:hypothetical protein
MLDVACDWCERRGRYRVARLITEQGADMGLPELGVTTRSVKNRTLSRIPFEIRGFQKRSFMNGFRLNGKS